MPPIPNILLTVRDQRLVPRMRLVSISEEKESLEDIFYRVVKEEEAN